MSEFLKNTAAQHLALWAVNRTDGLPVTTGASVQISIDGGVAATGSGTLSHIGKGQWDYIPTQAETNGDHLAFTIDGTDVINQGINIYTTTKRISQLNDFNPATDTVANVTNTAANADMRGTDGANTTVPMTAALSQTEHDATQSSIGALNDVAATEIVSAGPITTLSGAVVNVDLVDNTTANADMRGTDGANTVVPMTAALSQTEHDTTQSDIAAIPGGGDATAANQVLILNDTNRVDALLENVTGDRYTKKALEEAGTGVRLITG